MGFARQEYWSGVPLPSLSNGLVAFKLLLRAWGLLEDSGGAGGIKWRPRGGTPEPHPLLSQRSSTCIFVCLLRFFLIWTIFKVFIEFVTILLLLYFFGFLGPKARGILALPPGIEPTPPASEGEVLTIGLPGKSAL